MPNRPLRSHHHLIVFVLVLSAIIVSPVDPAAVVTDQCDWSVSGESPSLVQPLHARCSEGSIRWSYPQGALHLVLRLGSDRDFKGCVQATVDFKGARIYVEGRRRLHPLLTPSDGRDLRLPRCFQSQRGQVALYIEAEASDADNSMVAEFRYQLRTVTKRERLDPSEECRPCTADELLHAYCTSDFVVQGTISQVVHSEVLQRTEVTVDTSRVHYDRRLNSSPSFEKGQRAVLHVPLQCGVQPGSGEFVFFGRTFLGSAMVQCAPRLQEWWRIRTKALRVGANQCQL